MSTQAQLYDVIRRPLITEKTTMVSENNTVVFEVSPDSTKTEIKKAVETLFNVQVVSVNTATIHGKQKRFRGRLGRQNDVKKAYVRLAEGQSIDVTTGL